MKAMRLLLAGFMMPFNLILCILVLFGLAALSSLSACIQGLILVWSLLILLLGFGVLAFLRPSSAAADIICSSDVM